MTTQIYTLTDPNTNEIRYVGKSNNPTKRFYKHYKYCEHRTHKNNWINKLISEGKKPILDIIDTVPINEWVFWEMYWIEQMKVWGFKLVNGTIGGEGSTFGSSTSFKKGHKLGVGRKASDTTKEKIKNIRTGTKASEKTKAKMSISQKNILRDGLKLVETGKKTRFKKNSVPYNKGKSGYKLGGKKTSKPVLQFGLDGVFIGEFLGCKEAAIAINGNSETIRKCCHGQRFKSGGFKWKWKNDKK